LTMALPFYEFLSFSFFSLRILSNCYEVPY